MRQELGFLSFTRVGMKYWLGLVEHCGQHGRSGGALRAKANNILGYIVFLLIFVARDGSIDNPHVIGIMKGMITDMQCSLCGGYMTFYPDTEGGDFKSPGRIQCDNPCDPQCHESVKGHGVNAKEAYETSKILYRKP